MNNKSKWAENLTPEQRAALEQACEVADNSGREYVADDLRAAFGRKAREWDGRWAYPPALVTPGAAALREDSGGPGWVRVRVIEVLDDEAES